MPRSGVEEDQLARTMASKLSSGKRLPGYFRASIPVIVALLSVRWLQWPLSIYS